MEPFDFKALGLALTRAGRLHGMLKEAEAIVSELDDDQRSRLEGLLSEGATAELMTYVRGDPTLRRLMQLLGKFFCDMGNERG